MILIVLNLILGIIIDTFADLRKEKQENEEVRWVYPALCLYIHRGCYK